MRYRRGTAIVDTPRGILVAAGKHKIFLLPGGVAKKSESRKRAAIRELREETRLKAYSYKYLFSYHSRYARHKIFLIKAKGYARPSHEIRYIDYWKPGKNIILSHTTKIIINKYLSLKKEK